MKSKSIEVDELREISRKVYFYHILWKRADGHWIPRDSAFLETILRLNGLDDEIIVREDKVEKVSLMRKATNALSTDSVGTYVVWRIRKLDWPRPGNPVPPYESEIPSDFVSGDRTYLEPVYFIVVDGAYVASEFNINSVHARTQLEIAIKRRLFETESRVDDVDVVDAKVEPIYAKKVIDKLKRIKRTKWFEFGVKPRIGHVLSKSGKSPTRIAGIPSSLDKGNVTIRITAGRGKKFSSRFARAKNSLLKTVTSESQDLSEYFNSLRIQGEAKDGIVYSLDLIKQRLKTEVKATKLTNFKTIDPDVLYPKLFSAFNDNRSEIIDTPNVKQVQPNNP